MICLMKALTKLCNFFQKQWIFSDVKILSPKEYNKVDVLSSKIGTTEPTK